MKSWLGSGSHRTVIVHRGFDLAGIGLARGRYRGYSGALIWVAHLGYRN